MKITSIRVVQPQSSTMPKGWRGTMGQIVVAIDTDAGLTGYGIGGGGAAAIHVVQQELAPLLLGEDAAPVEELWERMYRTTLAYGRKGLAIMAISGVDLALWDLRGKAAGLSVAQVLSPSSAVDVAAYFTVGLAADNSIEGTERGLAKGYNAIKLGVGGLSLPQDTQRLLEGVGQFRRRIGGHVALMADAAMAWSDRDLVLELAQSLAEFDLDWLEEPLAADDLDGYAWLAERSPVPSPAVSMNSRPVVSPTCWLAGATTSISPISAGAGGLRSSGRSTGWAKPMGYVLSPTAAQKFSACMLYWRWRQVCLLLRAAGPGWIGLVAASWLQGGRALPLTDPALVSI